MFAFRVACFLLPFGNIFHIVAYITFMKKYILCTLVMTLSILAVGITLIGGASQSNTVMATSVNQVQYSNITVTGVGVVHVRPDFANINLTVETRNRNLAEAQKENTQRVQRLIKMLGEQGISEDSICTSWFNIYPEHDYGHYDRVSGHRVSNQLNVKVRDINNVGKIIDLAAAIGVTSVGGVQFGISDNTSAYNAALVKAIESAEQKALLLSAVTDIGDIKIISVKETNYYGFGGYSYRSYSVDGTPIRSNDIEVTAHVEVAFGIV